LYEISRRHPVPLLLLPEPNEAQIDRGMDREPPMRHRHVEHSGYMY
jgi:hypothetical protein